MADPTALDILNGSIVVAGFFWCTDCVSESYVWVRDSQGSTWRTVDWRDHVPEDLWGQFFTAVAMNGSRTAILAGNGGVLLTGGPLP